MSEIWTIIGKIGIITSVLVGLLKLYESLGTRRNKLHCRYRIHDFPIPPGVQDKLRNIDSGPEAEGVEFIRDSWLNYPDVVSGEIENTGIHPLEDVEIRINGGKLWKLSGQGDRSATYSSKDSINLGKLKAREKIEFIVWCSRFSGFGDEDRVIATHSKGVARQTVYKFTGPLGYNIEQLWSISLPIIIMILLVFIGAYGFIKAKGEEPKQTMEPTPADLAIAATQEDEPLDPK